MVTSWEWGLGEHQVGEWEVQATGGVVQHEEYSQCFVITGNVESLFKIIQKKTLGNKKKSQIQVKPQ